MGRVLVHSLHSSGDTVKSKLHLQTAQEGSYAMPIVCLQQASEQGVVQVADLSLGPRFSSRGYGELSKLLCRWLGFGHSG